MSPSPAHFARTPAEARICLILLAGLLMGCETLPEGPKAPGAVQSCTECASLECAPGELPKQGHSEPEVIEKVVYRTVEIPVPTEPERAGELELPIIGAVEWAVVEPPGVQLEARIDTGAETSSIHAEEIELVEIDGKRYVRYLLIDPATGGQHPMETRLRRRVLIRQADDMLERRFVVRLWVTLGEFRSRIEVTLSDRADMEYPLLIGRNMLTDTAVVDVSRRHTLAN